MAIKKDKIRGREVTTNSAYEELIDDNNAMTAYHLKNVAIHNMGGDKIHVIINGGDEISVQGNEVLTCGEIKVYSIVIVEAGSSVRYMGIQ